MSYYYNRQGQPITFDQWIDLNRDPAYKRVALDQLDGVEVSTVHLGIDHRFVGGGKPIIFETMMFGGPLDEECQRYSTEEAALSGHLDMLARVKAANA